MEHHQNYSPPAGLVPKAVLLLVGTITFSVVIIALVVWWQNDWHSLFDTLETVNLWCLLPIPLTLPLFYYCHGIRLRIALKTFQPHPPSASTLGQAMLSGTIVNAAIPGMGGEIVTAWVLSRKTSTTMPDYLAASAFTKILGLMVNSLLATLAISLTPRTGPSNTLATHLDSILLGLLALLLTALALAASFPWMLKKAAQILRPVNLDASDQTSRINRLRSRASKGLESMAAAFVRVRQLRFRYLATLTLTSLALNTAFSLVVLLGFLTVNTCPPLWQVLLFYSLLTVGNVVGMLFLPGMALVDLLGLYYWSRTTGMPVPTILLAMATVRLWQGMELVASGTLLFKNIKQLGKPAGQGETRNQ